MKLDNRNTFVGIIVFIQILTLIAWLARELITQIVFSGKSFDGRSEIFQISLISIYVLALLIISFLLLFIYRKASPSEFQTLRGKVDLFLERNTSLLNILIIPIPFFIFLLVRNAWISDDAFITMRVVDNFLNGYGLVWNVGERVQVFTHPLWFFLVTPVYAILRDAYQTLHWVSLTISLITVFLVLVNFAKSKKSILIACVLLSSSMAFVDYCSSGLENPLSHLLLTILLIIIMRQSVSIKSISIIAVLASFSALNRLDSILFFVPVLIYQLYVLRKHWQKLIPLLLLCSLPLVIWEIFSIIYYGFPFPNTFYAKVGGVDLPFNWYLSNASNYFMNSIKWDPITLTVILISMSLTFLERKIEKIFILIGMIFYLLYIISIGGDFMSGRFFSTLYLISILLLLSLDYASILGRIDNKGYALAVIIVLVLGMSSSHPPIFIKASDAGRFLDEKKIANEKLYYYSFTNWIGQNQRQEIFPWASSGIALKNSGESFAKGGSIGFYGYYAGPNVYILDTLALADPLLSRLPSSDSSRIGHFQRDIPDGYADTIKDDFNNHIINENLHRFYDKLSLIIHGEIFTKNRVEEIIKFNLGNYDYLAQKPAS